MGSHLLLQGIFPIQASNTRLLHWQADWKHRSHITCSIQNCPEPLKQLQV